jgi:hypothetical protein
MKFLERHARTILGGSDTPIAKAAIPFDITPVAEWYFKDAEVYETPLREQFPCVVAPFPVTYFEYKIPGSWKIRTDDGKWIQHSTPHGPSDYFGMLIVQEQLPPGFTGNDPVEGQILQKVMSALPDKATPMFLQYTFLFAGNGNDCMPMFWVRHYVDSSGRMMGGPVYNVHPTLLSNSPEKTEGEAYGDILRAYGYPVYFALSLLTHAMIEELPVSDRERKQAAKNKETPFVYRSIIIEPLLRAIRSGEHGQDNSVLTAMRLAGADWAKHIGEQLWWEDYVRIVKGTEKAVADLKTFKFRINNRAKKRVYPQWVCSDCAVAAGGKKRGENATWHEGKCGICGLTKGVTEPRDFGHPQFYARQ